MVSSTSCWIFVLSPLSCIRNGMCLWIALFFYKLQITIRRMAFVLSVAFPFWTGTLFNNSVVVESLSLLFLSRSSNHLGLPLFSLPDSLAVHWKFSDAKLSMVTFISTFYFQGFFALNTGNTLSLSFFSFYGAGTVLPFYSTWAERLCSNF